MKTLIKKNNEFQIADLENINDLVDFYNQGHHSQSENNLRIFDNAVVVDRKGFVYAYSHDIKDFIWLSFRINYTENKAFSKEIQIAKSIAENEDFIYWIVDRGEYCKSFETVPSNNEFYIQLNYNSLFSEDHADDFEIDVDEESFK